jgi:hypothetical protein
MQARTVFINQKPSSGIGMYNLESVQAKLSEYFNSLNEVTLAYLFGSVARGDDNRLSDVDIGVLLDESLSKQDIFRLELHIIDDVAGLLGSSRIDLCIMNQASLLLNFNIIKDGYVLKSDEVRRVSFEKRVMSRYLDEMFYRQRYMRENVKQMTGAGNDG